MVSISNLGDYVPDPTSVENITNNNQPYVDLILTTAKVGAQVANFILNQYLWSVIQYPSQIASEALSKIFELAETLRPHLTSAGYGALALCRIPTTIYGVYKLKQKWHTRVPLHNALKVLTLIQTNIGAAASGTYAFTMLHVVPKAVQIGAASVSLILGPISYLTLALIEIGSSIKRAVKAAKWARRADAAHVIISKLDQKKSPLTDAFLKREMNRFLTKAHFTLFKSGRSAIIGACLLIAVGASTLAATGVLAAALTTPIGWAIYGIVAAGLVLSLGKSAYTKWHAKQQAAIEQTKVISKLAEAYREQYSQLVSKLDTFSAFFLNLDKPKDRVVVADILYPMIFSQPLSEMKDAEVINQKLEELNIGPIQDLDQLIDDPAWNETFVHDLLAEKLRGQDSDHWHNWLVAQYKEQLKTEVREWTIDHLTAELQKSMGSVKFGNNFNVMRDGMFTRDYIKSAIDQPSWPGNPSLIDRLVEQMISPLGQYTSDAFNELNQLRTDSDKINIKMPVSPLASSISTPNELQRARG